MYTGLTFCSLLESNTLKLDWNTLGKLMHGNTAASRLVGEVLLKHSVHLCKVSHINEEDLVILQVRIGVQWAPQRQGEHTLTLTTLSMEEPAAASTAQMLRQQRSVFSAMLPSSSLPVLSAGIWPETKTCPPALMAWLYELL